MMRSESRELGDRKANPRVAVGNGFCSVETLLLAPVLLKICAKGWLLIWPTVPTVPRSGGI